MSNIDVAIKIEYWNGKNWKPMSEINPLPNAEAAIPEGFKPYGCSGVSCQIIDPLLYTSVEASNKEPPSVKVYEEPEPNGRRIDLGGEEE